MCSIGVLVGYNFVLFHYSVRGGDKAIVSLIPIIDVLFIRTNKCFTISYNILDTLRIYIPGDLIGISKW